MMSWKEHHDRSMEFASQAQVLVWRGEVEAAKPYYAMAAEAEVEALGALEPEKLRTLGITVVSAVALWFKAGSWGRRRCWLMSGWLVVGFAIVQLEEILREILGGEMVVV